MRVSASEIAYCKAKKNPWPHFAVRFAAKEAVYKTLGNAEALLEAAGLEPTRRAEEIPVEGFCALARAVDDGI